MSVVRASRLTGQVGHVLRRAGRGSFVITDVIDTRFRQVKRRRLSPVGCIRQCKRTGRETAGRRRRMNACSETSLKTVTVKTVIRRCQGIASAVPVRLRGGSSENRTKGSRRTLGKYACVLSFNTDSLRVCVHLFLLLFAQTSAGLQTAFRVIHCMIE